MSGLANPQPLQNRRAPSHQDSLNAVAGLLGEIKAQRACYQQLKHHVSSLRTLVQGEHSRWAEADDLVDLSVGSKRMSRQNQNSFEGGRECIMRFADFLADSNKPGRRMLS